MKMNMDSFCFLGLRSQTVKSLQFDQTKAVVDDEFMRKGDGSCYRARAIKRLISLFVPWRTENNILHNVVNDYLSLKCPYCHTPMTCNGGGGNSEVYSIHWHCQTCQASASMSVDPNKFIHFMPNPTDLNNVQDLL